MAPRRRPPAPARRRPAIACAARPHSATPTPMLRPSPLPCHRCAPPPQWRRGAPRGGPAEGGAEGRAARGSVRADAGSGAVRTRIADPLLQARPLLHTSPATHVPCCHTRPLLPHTCPHRSGAVRTRIRESAPARGRGRCCGGGLIELEAEHSGMQMTISTGPLIELEAEHSGMQMTISTASNQASRVQYSLNSIGGPLIELEAERCSLDSFWVPSLTNAVDAAMVEARPRRGATGKALPELRVSTPRRTPLRGKTGELVSASTGRIGRPD
jgi:hypothetical protein